MKTTKYLQRIIKEETVKFLQERRPSEQEFRRRVQRRHRGAFDRGIQHGEYPAGPKSAAEIAELGALSDIPHSTFDIEGPQIQPTADQASISPEDALWRMAAPDGEFTEEGVGRLIQIIQTLRRALEPATDLDPNYTPQEVLDDEGP